MFCTHISLEKGQNLSHPVKGQAKDNGLMERKQNVVLFMVLVNLKKVFGEKEGSENLPLCELVWEMVQPSFVFTLYRWCNLGNRSWKKTQTTCSLETLLPHYGKQGKFVVPHSHQFIVLFMIQTINNKKINSTLRWINAAK